MIRDLFETDISVDLFAGGGGASVGTEAATGRPVDVAINHDKVAIAVHRANHPTTAHYTTDVFEVSPEVACRGRHVRHLHASPDCKDFSRAKGGKPKSGKIRSLAWVVCKWARRVRPDIITLENVPEFLDWGPLDKTGKRIPARKGEIFRRWKRYLEGLGYVVEHRMLVASHYGAPTSRKRFFLVARCDGQPIVWPERTHGPGLKPYRTAAECIDWSLPCPSIFDRKRPLKPKTLKRIAAGIVRFVLQNPRPFIVSIDHQSSPRADRSADAPLSTISTKARHVVVTPFIAGCGGRAGQSPSTAADAPLGTVTAKNDRVVVTPYLVQNNHSEKKNPYDNGSSVTNPLRTVVAGGTHHAVVAPTLIQTSYGERKGQKPRVLDLHAPLGTVVAQGQKHAVVSAFLAKHYGGVTGVPFDGRPLDTVTAVDHHSVVTSTLAVLRNNCDAASLDEPAPTICAGGNHLAEVRAFLTSYYGEGTGQDASSPLRTITTKDRFAVVTVVIDGITYAIVDIGLRMLEPHELLRAQFGRFAKRYDLSAAKTKRDQVRLIGNSVCPELQEAVLRANLGPRRRQRRAA